MFTYSQPSFFQFHLKERWGMGKCTLVVISQERLKIEVKLPLSADRKSYMPRRLAQQQMTLSDLEWPLHHPYHTLSLRYLSFLLLWVIMQLENEWHPASLYFIDVLAPWMATSKTCGHGKTLFTPSCAMSAFSESYRSGWKSPLLPSYDCIAQGLHCSMCVSVGLHNELKTSDHKLMLVGMNMCYDVC